MATALGRRLRKFRIDKGMYMAEMADRLKISLPMLSAIEIGKRSVPNDFVSKLIEAYSELSKVRDEMTAEAAIANKEFKFMISEEDLDLVAALARKLRNTDAEEFKKSLKDWASND